MERLEKIVTEIRDFVALKHKKSFYFSVDGKTSEIKTNFNPPIELNDGAYEIALVNLMTYYSFPNVDSSNNSLRYYNGTAWSTIVIPEGCYELKDIATYIQKEVGGDNILLEPNLNTLKSIMTIKTGYKVDFNVNNSLSSILGFEKNVYEQGVHDSEEIVNILSVYMIKVLCSGIGNSYTNGKEDNAIYSFSAGVAPGYKIIEKPFQPIYLPLTSSLLDSFYVKLTDQNNRLLNLRGEECVITFHIRQV